MAGSGLKKAGSLVALSMVLAFALPVASMAQDHGGRGGRHGEGGGGGRHGGGGGGGGNWQRQAPAPQQTPQQAPQQQQRTWTPPQVQQQAPQVRSEPSQDGWRGRREPREWSQDVAPQSPQNAGQRNWQGRSQRREAPQQQAQQGGNQTWRGRGNPDGAVQNPAPQPVYRGNAADRGRSAEHQDRGAQGRTWQGRNPGYVDPARNGTYRNQDRRRNDDWRGRDQRRDDGWRGNNRRDDRRDYDRSNHRGWDHGWRGNNRYDWFSYRNQHRNYYQQGYYYAPYRNYSYRRLSIGFFLDSLFFGQSYWIDNPWYYRLPDADGPYRWVRYYDDVLLVDIYSGEVVDVIYDFFW